MPTYMGKEVSDFYIQALVGAFRDGQKSAGLEVEDGDQVILDQLAAHNVATAHAPSAFALGAGTGENTGPEPGQPPVTEPPPPGTGTTLPADKPAQPQAKGGQRKI
jgi:hypothetical protein